MFSSLHQHHHRQKCKQQIPTKTPTPPPPTTTTEVQTTNANKNTVIRSANNNKNTMIFTNATLWFGRNHALIHDKTFFLKIIFCFLFCAPLLWTCHLGLIFTHFVDLPIWNVEPWIIITQFEIHNYNYTIQQYSDSAQIHPKRFSSHARISSTFFGQ